MVARAARCDNECLSNHVNTRERVSKKNRHTLWLAAASGRMAVAHGNAPHAGDGPASICLVLKFSP
jgi:hypothetical protein